MRKGGIGQTTLHRAIRDATGRLNRRYVLAGVLLVVAVVVGFMVIKPNETRDMTEIDKRIAELEKEKKTITRLFAELSAREKKLIEIQNSDKLKGAARDKAIQDQKDQMKKLRDQLKAAQSKQTQACPQHDGVGDAGQEVQAGGVLHGPAARAPGLDRDRVLHPRRRHHRDERARRRAVPAQRPAHRRRHGDPERDRRGVQA